MVARERRPCIRARTDSRLGQAANTDASHASAKNSSRSRRVFGPRSLPSMREPSVDGRHQPARSGHKWVTCNRWKSAAPRTPVSASRHIFLLQVLELAIEWTLACRDDMPESHRRPWPSASPSPISSSLVAYGPSGSVDAAFLIFRLAGQIDADLVLTTRTHAHAHRAGPSADLEAGHARSGATRSMVGSAAR
jgi:hypothetical protein